MSFETNRSGALLWHTSTLFDAGAVCHGFSTRPGGVSPAPWDSLNLGVGRGDTEENVQENFRRFCAAVGADPMRVVLSKQVHEPNVRLVTGADAGKGLWRERDYKSVDAMICNTPNLPLVVFSADCGIILLHDPVHAAVGAVHAGWRGAAQGLVSIALRRMGEVFGTHPADVRAAIGAGIGPCCFETDGDVPQAMRAALGAAAEPYIEQRGAKWHVDLKGINAHWLRADGVEQIDVCAHCTACRPDLYWSHRRMGNARGAQIAMIALR